MSNIPDWWAKTDEISMARKLRLAVIQNAYSGGFVSKEGALEILSGLLDPDDPTTVYDDSQWLRILPETDKG